MPQRPGACETNFVDVTDETAPGVRVMDLHLGGPLWSTTFPCDKLVKKGLASLATRATIQDLARKDNIDVLLLYNIPQVILAGAIPATLVVDLADDLPAMLGHEVGIWGRGALALLARASLQQLIGSADLLTTPSSVLKERLPRHAFLLPNGVDLSAITAANGGQIRSRFPHPILGFVGAFEYFVDFDLVLAVAGRLLECTFLLVGGGRQWSRVRDEVHRRQLQNVQLTGAVPYGKALDYMASLDIALIPFRPGPVSDAASPLKLFEYLALQKPVISTPGEEVRRVAGEWAWLASTPAEWVRIIQGILQSPEVGARRAQAAYGHIRLRYLWDFHAARLEAMIDLARRSSPRGAPHLALWDSSCTVDRLDDPNDTAVSAKTMATTAVLPRRSIQDSAPRTGT